MYLPLYSSVLTIYLITYLSPINTKTKDKFPQLNSTKLNCDTCPRVYFPLCGNDTKTYINECKLICANSKKDKDKQVSILRYGPCILGSRRDYPDYVTSDSEHRKLRVQN